MHDQSGAPPLQQSKRVTHSVDADLAAAAALARRAYVVTRNLHRADILTFLAAQGVRFDDVVVVQKKKSKATEIAPRLAPGERGLFVDDDVRECCDPKVAARCPASRGCCTREVARLGKTILK